jgi:hypothetical protein
MKRETTTATSKCEQISKNEQIMNLNIQNLTILESEQISKTNNYRIRTILENEPNFKTKQILKLNNFRIRTNFGFEQNFNVNEVRM